MIEKARTPEKSVETPEFEQLSVACAGFVRERADLEFTPDKTDILSMNEALREMVEKNPEAALHLVELLQEPASETPRRREIAPNGHAGEITNRLTGLVAKYDAAGKNLDTVEKAKAAKEFFEAELAIVRAAIVNELIAAQERARQATAGIRDRILKSLPAPRDKAGEVTRKALDTAIARAADDKRRAFALMAYRASLN